VKDVYSNETIEFPDPHLAKRLNCAVGQMKQLTLILLKGCAFLGSQNKI